MRINTKGCAAAILGVALLGASWATVGGEAPRVSAATAQAELDALIRAAKSDGELLYYSTATENVAKRSSDAFFAKYGVRANYLRIGGARMRQRYSAEVEAGQVLADLILNAGGNTVEYAEEGIKKGYAESISEAGIPVLRSGEFPARFVTGPTVIIQIAPWLFAYNTDKVKSTDLPKDWPGLLNPKFKGLFLLPHPDSADSYMDLWSLLLDRYGEGFYKQLRAQELRWSPGGVPGMQSLGAGEAAIYFPAVSAQVTSVSSKGAPLAMVTPDLTTGVEMQIMLSSRTKAKHGAAARLFANYLMSPEGNAVFNDDPGGMTVYDTSRLPKQYESPKSGVMARRALVNKLLGF